MFRELLLCLVLALVATIMYVVEWRRQWKNNINVKNYFRVAALLWALSFLLGCQQGWWQALDGVTLLVGVCVTGAVRTKDPDLRGSFHIVGCATLALWQWLRWSSNYNWWQMTICVSCGILIPIGTYINVTAWPAIWRARKRRQFGDAVSLPAL